MNTKYPDEVACPGFDELDDLAPGVYGAEFLNPPSGADCAYLIVREDGTLGWCDADGEECGSVFTVRDLRRAGCK